MEEKERYDVKRLSYSLNVKLTDNYESDWRYIIFDDVNDVELDKLETVCNLLNQQDKELSKLRASYQQVKEENQQLIKALNGEVFINYKLPMENAQLKQQLAESEKNFIIANNLRKNSNEVLLNYKTEKYGLDKTIQELRKMKLSFPEKEWYYKGFENCERQMSSHIADLTLQVKELKQQLHDLPNKIVGEIRKEIEFPLYVHPDFDEFECLFDIDKLLDTILKKFGGEDESE